MGRLIDEGELVKVLEERATNEAICGYMTAYDVTNSIIDEVNEQPTAYDPDKVVEQLETMRMRYYLTYANTGNKTNDEVWEKASRAMDDAIEIVKSGGNADLLMDRAKSKSGNCIPYDGKWK